MLPRDGVTTHSLYLVSFIIVPFLCYTTVVKPYLSKLKATMVDSEPAEVSSIREKVRSVLSVLDRHC